VFAVFCGVQSESAPVGCGVQSESASVGCGVQGQSASVGCGVHSESASVTGHNTDSTITLTMNVCLCAKHHFHHDKNGCD
jgi:hypothetical protein